MNKLLIICGPTATGKTDLAVSVAKKCNGEIISADSRQVYRGLDILTGKDIDMNQELRIKNKELGIENSNFTVGYRMKDEIPIWLVDIVDINYQFNIGDYSKLVPSVIKNIISRKKLPILVGGTGMYIRSIIQPYDTQSIPPDKNVREKLELLEKEELQNTLKDINSEKWNVMNKSDQNNPRRLIRAIEIAQYKKINKSTEGNQKRTYDQIKIGLKADNKNVYDRIDKRVEKRIQQGVVEEINKIIKQIKNTNTQSLSATGVNIIIDYIQHKIDLEQTKQKWKFKEHAYARRQLTWFKKETDIFWFDINKKNMYTKIEKQVQAWYTKYDYDSKN
jgi:tRNA dimethylallyltransferase